MRVVGAFLASLFLFLTVASLAIIPIIGAAFALLLFFPLFLLALLGVMSGVRNRSVDDERDLAMEGWEWRDGPRRREVTSSAALVDRPAQRGRAPSVREAGR
jgi:hypothetical protein